LYLKKIEPRELFFFCFAVIFIALYLTKKSDSTEERVVLDIFSVSFQNISSTVSLNMQRTNTGNIVFNSNYLSNLSSLNKVYSYFNPSGASEFIIISDDFGIVSLNTTTNQFNISLRYFNVSPGQTFQTYFIVNDETSPPNQISSFFQNVTITVPPLTEFRLIS